MLANEMRLVITATLVAVVSTLTAQETAPKQVPVQEKKTSGIGDASAGIPDPSTLSPEKWKELQQKWLQEEAEWMEQLQKESKKPSKDSRYIGTWCDKDSNKPELVLSPDGSFTYDYGHSKGTGVWLEYKRGPIFLKFADANKNNKGAEQVYFSTYLCHLVGGDTLVQSHGDYNQYYKRQKPQEAKENAGSDQNVGDKIAPLPGSAERK